jgi:hypothetical protein
MAHRERWQMAITPSCTTRLITTCSASLFPFCWAIPHVRQTRRNRSFPSPITNNKIPPLLSPTVGQPIERLLEDWHWLIARSGLKIGKTRQDKLSTK